jgi:hypothetical protein
MGEGNHGATYSTTVTEMVCSGSFYSVGFTHVYFCYTFGPFNYSGPSKVKRFDSRTTCNSNKKFGLKLE